MSHEVWIISDGHKLLPSLVKLQALTVPLSHCPGPQLLVLAASEGWIPSVLVFEYYLCDLSTSLPWWQLKVRGRQLPEGR